MINPIIVPGYIYSPYPHRQLHTLKLLKLNVISKPLKILIISITIHQIFTIFNYIFTKRILKDSHIFFSGLRSILYCRRTWKFILISATSSATYRDRISTKSSTACQDWVMRIWDLSFITINLMVSSYGCWYRLY